MGRKSEEDKTNEKTAIAPISLDLKLAKLQQPEAENVDISNLPKEWQTVDALGGFPPSPEFTIPGESVFGVFVNCRTDVGPNHSRLYEMMAHLGAGKKPELISIWGSTALDRCFDSAMPPIKSGDKLGIVYVGSKDTKRGMNPVKLFKVYVKRPEDSGVETHTPTAGNGRPATDITPPKEKVAPAEKMAAAGSK